MLILLSSYLYADVWNSGTQIEYEAYYPAFIVQNSEGMFTCSCRDKDEKTNANNQTSDEPDTFVGYNSNNPNFSFWTLGTGLTFDTEHHYVSPSTIETIYWGNIISDPGDYKAYLNIQDKAELPQGDTGSRNDTDVSEEVDVTVVNIGISSPAPSAIINNETTLLVGFNDDDDNLNGIIYNTETNVLNENDLTPITLTISPNNNRVRQYCHVKLYGSGVKVFANDNRTSEYILTYSLSDNSPVIDFSSSNSVTIYVEPQSTSISTLYFNFYSTVPSPSLLDDDRTDILPNNLNETRHIKILGNRVNLNSGVSDNIENSTPGKVIPKYDYLNQGVNSLAISVAGINNYLSNATTFVLESDNDNIEFYSNYALTNQIDINTEYSGNSIPNIIYVKGIENDVAQITGTLKYGGSIIHQDNVLYSVVQTDISHDPDVLNGNDSNFPNQQMPELRNILSNTVIP